MLPFSWAFLGEQIARIGKKQGALGRPSLTALVVVRSVVDHWWWEDGRSLGEGIIYQEKQVGFDVSKFLQGPQLEFMLFPY